jgi:DNA transformation protein and related proteins
MPASDRLVERVLKLLLPLGPVEARRMFGGHGLYLEGTIFALLFDGALYLKADERTTAAFKRRGLGPLSYEGRRGQTINLPYWQAPPELLEDGPLLSRWARKAYAAGQRFEARKKKPAPATSKPGRLAGAKPLEGRRAPRFKPDF